MMPAASASASDSSRNDPITAQGRKPSARSVPISVVRADTDAYIVFIAAKTAPIPMITATIIPQWGAGIRPFVCPFPVNYEHSMHSRLWIDQR